MNDYSDNIVVGQGLSRLVCHDPSAAMVEQDDSREEALKAEQIRRQAVAETEKRMNEALTAERAKQKELKASLESAYEKFLSNVQVQIGEQLIKLSVRIAEIILRHKLPDHSMINGIIHETLEPVTDLHGAKVFMPPAEANAMLATRGGGGLQSISDRVEIIADDSLAPGDILIESRNGYFDARIAERLKLLEERLLARHKDANADVNQP